MTKATILIVDDDVANIEIMNAALEDDYDVCFASSGEDALDVARAVQPDLVLLDVVMPGIDGFEACRKFKTDPLLADVPVIFTTGLGDTEAEMRGLSLGAIDYITKPVQPALLRARVANHVELKRMRDRLAQMAVTDALTGLSNRRHLEIDLAADCGRLSRGDEWLSVIMVDIDFFKQFNDTYGHQAGDRCIMMIASALTRAIRNLSGDLNGKAARYGGEEFLCALPGADPVSAGEVALEIKRQVDALCIPHKTSRIGPQVTVSIGVACARCRDGMTPDHWIAAADAQLYKSKSYGRDRVTLDCFEGVASH
ncbi:diguanylate cyclase (GGDEF)-like protein [Novosphingobium sp. PhB165]|uniref:diguanylate cyclase n=1 Tax=Novosphingobium sp. PhB165 TaxID=2485105 RepID=UPI0010469F9D|nr:diguanylate cyclase [Novosphingobium sp. PhB165]TCM20778.1 diguanylate cyclase (GGDEF)-like protein [Novosphingobium sp. PhB165]